MEVWGGSGVLKVYYILGCWFVLGSLEGWARGGTQFRLTRSGFFGLNYSGVEVEVWGGLVWRLGKVGVGV